MKKNREIQNRKKKTAIYFAAGFFAVMGFVFLLIYPAKKQTDRLNKEIQDINLRIKKQEILQPAHTRLMITSMEIEKKIKEIEKTKSKSFLNHSDILMLPESFEKAAFKSGLKLTACSPDINSFVSKKNKFQLSLELEGDFLNFPDFLSALETEKKITEIQSIEIYSGREKKFLLILWLNMDK
jgi:hypothetical protein